MYWIAPVLCVVVVYLSFVCHNYFEYKIELKEYLERKRYSKPKHWTKDLDSSFFASVLIGALLFVLLTGMINLVADKEWQNDGYQPIYAMQDNSTYYLRHVHVGDSNMRYYYMVETSNGLAVSWASTDISYIKETSETPHAKHFKRKFTNKTIAKYFGVVNSSGNDVRVEFHIPKGSVKQEFNVDLK